jgi:hypothetical protein
MKGMIFIRRCHLPLTFSSYESISDLMTLQDQIDSFQKLIFAHIPQSSHSECRISALVPLVQESYGIYKFITSMLRAMHTTLGDDEVLQPLRGRYDMQHYRLVKFYYECSQLRYLTSLITVPKLPQDPPNLLSEDDERPALPSRPTKDIEKPSTPPRAPSVDPEPINEFWKNQKAREQDAFAEEQRRLAEQWEAAQRLQEEQARQAQLDFENQQRLQAEQQRLAADQLAREQMQQHIGGQMARLQQENMDARNQYERDQLLLQQYDQRMKALETEIAQMQNNYQQTNQSKDDQIRALQEELKTWRAKYENLAKLYSQLRGEHIELLQKFKGVQTKASSAQEAIDQREKLQRELKQKNLDLASMIRERDKARMDRDRAQGGLKEEIEKLKRELRFAREQAENADRSKGTELSAMLARHNRDITNLEDLLREKTSQLSQINDRYRNGDSDLEQQLAKSQTDLAAMEFALDEALQQLNQQREQHDAEDNLVDGQVSTVIAHNLSKINDLIDSILSSGIQRVDDAIYELESSMIAGNQNASGAFVLSQIEKAAQNTLEFSTAFREFIADGSNSEHSEIVRTVHAFSGSVADVLTNTKGLTRFASDERKSDGLINAARKAALSTIKFFKDMQSFRLAKNEDDEKQAIIFERTREVQFDLENLSKLADAFAPKSKITKQQGDLGDLVDRELTNAAAAIDAAAERLNNLMHKSREGYSTYELKIHE